MACCGIQKFAFKGGNTSNHFINICLVNILSIHPISSIYSVSTILSIYTSLPLQLNPVYRFLFDQQLPDHLYYRWKVISLCCGRHVTPYLTPHIPHIRR